jgi:protein O-GlcNAc transferase
MKPADRGREHKQAAADPSRAAAAAAIDLVRQGLALQRQGRLDEAGQAYRRALAVAPNMAAAHHLLGLVEHQHGRHEEAHESMARAVRLVPDNADYLGDLGLVLKHLRRFGEAESALVAARRLRPGDARILNNLAAVHLGLNRPEAAAECLRAAIAGEPRNAAMHNNLGNVLNMLGQTGDAVASFRQALALDPGYVEAHSNLGHALAGAGKLDEAIGEYRAALQLQPDAVGARFNLAVALSKKGELAEAMEAFRTALALNPRSIEALSGFGEVLHRMGRTEEAIAQYELMLERYPEREMVLSNLLFLKNYLAKATPREMVAEARRYGDLVARSAGPLRAHANARDPERRLRVGLVSGDFCAHPVARFLDAVLGEIDPAKIELFAYATAEAEDALTQRLRGNVPNWRQAWSWPPDRLAEAIRADAIDILVDLSGHTAHHRLSVFARKPAPLHVTWLGYFATTGVGAIDYVLANRWVIPADEEDQWVEKPWRLPDTYLCFTPPPAIPITPLPADAAGILTFGSFNNLNKLSDRTVEVWSGVLSAVPGSRLLLRGEALESADTRRITQQRFGAFGIAPERLLLEGFAADYATHLAHYNRVDIALDSFPYAGGTTTVEALWMGVPVLTLEGDRYVAHMGESIMHNMGMPEWIAADPQAFVRQAAEAAGDREALAALRAGLRDRLLASPLMDAPAFARNLEAAFRGMWRRWCAGQDGSSSPS